MLAIRCLRRCLLVLKSFSNGFRMDRTYASEAKFNIAQPYKLYNLDEGPKLSITLTRDEALHLLEQMIMVRQLEIAAGDLYKAQLVRGFCHLYLGEEACCVGMKNAMRPQDSSITAYRCHGWAYLMDIPVQEVLAELIGRTTGTGRGKGGSMHIYGKQFYGGSGIVGAQVPVGTGVALAYKYRGEDGVCITCYGDGAANQGQVFESFNIAKLWDLPVVFVCENNLFAGGTSAVRSSANMQYFTRCEYIPGIWVDGMDVLAVREATHFAISHCTTQRGPIILELSTYRYSGHSMSDAGTNYRTREEVKAIRKSQDPIKMFQDRMLHKALATELELKELCDKVKHIVQEAVKTVSSEKEPEIEEMAGDVYINPLRKMARGVSPFHWFEYKKYGTPVHKMS